MEMPECVLCKQPVGSENNYLCEECFQELVHGIVPIDREDALEGWD